MNDNPSYTARYDEPAPIKQHLEQETVKGALDELFRSALKYRSTHDYRELLEFIRRFRFYSPYNAMLVQAQMRGARYVASARRWRTEFGYLVKTDAHPLIILQPMGPVMFVFDVSDVEPGPKAKTLPKEITAPFDIINGSLRNEFERTESNAKRDGIRIRVLKGGSQSAGSMTDVFEKQLGTLQFKAGVDKQKKPIYVDIPIRYDLIVNSNHKKVVQYATLVHELAHLYCGHLGTPNKKWWPDRKDLSLLIREFEAESVTWLICGRKGIENPSEDYLSGYLNEKGEIPQISLECVMKACGLIERMGYENMKSRKQKETS